MKNIKLFFGIILFLSLPPINLIYATAWDRAQTSKSGTVDMFEVLPEYLQVDSTAENRDFHIKRNERAIGSGTQYYFYFEGGTLTVSMTTDGVFRIGNTILGSSTGNASYPINLAGGTATTGILPENQGGFGTSTPGYVRQNNGSSTGQLATNITIAGTGTDTATMRTNGVDISPTEKSYLDGVTSNIQTQIDAIPVGTNSGWVASGTQTVAASGLRIVPQGTIAVHADYGIVGILDRDIPPTITLDNLTQITTRNYDDVSGTATIKPTQIAIGTTTYQGALNAVGSATFSGTLTAGGFSGNGTGLTGKENTLSNSAGLAAAISDETGTNTVVFSSGSTQANPTFTGSSNFPSGIWNSSGNVGLGTTTPTGKLVIATDAATHLKLLNAAASAGGTIYYDVTNDGIRIDTKAIIDGNVGIGTSTPSYKIHTVGSMQFENSPNAFMRLKSTSGTRKTVAYQFVDSADNLLWSIYNDPDASNIKQLSIYDDGSGTARFNITANGSVNVPGNFGFGTTTPGNIITCPIASSTDPIADTWTQHCLSDYKDMGTETTEMIQNSANNIVKNTPVSIFTKKAIIADEEAEREPKQKYQDAIRESAKTDLELYTAETGVNMQDNSYVNELLESMWETKADRLTIVESNKQKLTAKKKALPKFQRKNYGIVAEDAPPEAQIFREDGSLQGVDPSVLIGILWANAQKQEARISALETKIEQLKAITGNPK